MTVQVFIDGEAGTTGLQISDRLAGRSDLRLLTIDPAQRKDPTAREALLNEADVVILCLPDQAARDAVGMIRNPAVKVIDASTAHRVAEGWTFGFPEMVKGQRDAISMSPRVANPGCYSTGAIALLRPLTEAGLLPRDWPVTIAATSGYSGGGKSMIAEFEDKAGTNYTETAYRIYGLGLDHKHLPEIAAYTPLSHMPVFMPAVARYAQGMIVEAPLPLWAIPGAPTVGQLHEALVAHYQGERFVEVAPLGETASMKSLDPEGLNGTNQMRLFVFGAMEGEQARLVALLDNLGKGAAGAAVQNLNLMAGLNEAEGL